MDWLSKTAARVLMGLVAALLIVGLLWLRSCQQERSAKAQATLAKSQASAATASGSDAANTVGNRMAADAETDTLTRSNADEIHKADGADAPVAGGVSAAGRASLCRRAAYQHDPKCVQHAYPR